MGTADDVLAAARGEIGYSRWSDPEAGTKYGRWYAEASGEPYYGSSGVPYCAMFASWCLAQAGASAPGIPGAYCPYIEQAGRDAGRAVANGDARAGDLVLFDWGGDGVADHIGIVEENHPRDGYMTTIEGNTSGGSSGSQSNGGGVWRRQRGYGSVRCVVRPYYDEEEEDVLTDHQDELLATIYQQVTGTYDPTGRGVELCDHDHIKWIGAKVTDLTQAVAALTDKVDDIAAKMGK